MVHRRSSSNNNLEANCIVEANNHENVTENKTSTSKDESSNARPNNSNEVSSELEHETNESRSNKKKTLKQNNIKEVATKISNKIRLNAAQKSSSTKHENGSTSNELESKTKETKSLSDLDGSKHQEVIPKKEEDGQNDATNLNISLTKGSKGIICSLPLERLSGILGTITLSKESNSNSNNKTNSSISILDVQNYNKILCLYCDRTFSSQKLHLKHNERAHKLSEGRRSSIRNTSNASINNNNGIPTSSSSPTITSSSSSGVFAGCSFCTSNKLSPMVADDLDILFNHIVDIHNDKYFACRECTTRFINEDNLNNHLKNAHNQEIPQKKPSLPITKPLSVIVDFEDEIIARMQATKRDMDDVRLTRNAVKSMQDSHLSAKEQMLMRLGIAQHRSPRTRKGAKNRRGAPTDGTRSEVYRPSRSRCGRSSVTNLNSSESNDFIIQRNKNEVLNCTFDEDFYETVSNNVRLNLSCHLDGKLDSNPTAPSPLSPVAVCPTVRSTVVHNPLVTDSEIHEATSLSTTTAFPTLLTVDQYGKNVSATNKYKKPMTKNSWKWKWDLVKKYKYVNEGGKIVKKVKQPISGLRDLSKLDMWTQLVMRKKHEDLVASEELDSSKEDANCNVRQEKRRIVEQLNCILDKRLLPQINVEQDEQRVIKPDPDEDEQKSDQPTSSSDIKKNDQKHIPEILKLLPAQQLTQSKLILSGEWARPRCYICFCCGLKFDTIKNLEEHKSGRHTHTTCTHYEVVGRELIEKQFYNNFYLPTKALEQNHLVKHGSESVTENDIVARLKEKETTIPVEDSMDSVTSTSVSIVTSNTNETDSNTKSSSKTSTTASYYVQQSPLKSSCSKCSKETNSLLDLHRHILDCSGDYAWAQVKKRLKYRRLLGKKRRVCRGLNIVRRPKSLSKTDDDKDDEKDDNESPKPKLPATPKVRPSDAESIQRMLANLPPKRTCRQILSLNNQTLRRKIQSKAMQPQISLKKEDFDSSKMQNDKKCDSSHKSEKKSLRSSASSTPSSNSSSKETTPIQEGSPTNSEQKKGFIKQVHAKARSVIRNLNKTFAKSPIKRQTRSSNNSSPDIIIDEERKTPEKHDVEPSELSKSAERHDLEPRELSNSTEKNDVEPSELSKSADDAIPIKIVEQTDLQTKYETVKEKVTELDINDSDKNNEVPSEDAAMSNTNEEKHEIVSDSIPNFEQQKVISESSNKTKDLNDINSEPIKTMEEPKVPEIVNVNKDGNAKSSTANRRSNRRKGPARKSICSVEKDYESDFNETKEPIIQNTTTKINIEAKTLLNKSVVNLPFENMPPSIPSNTQLSITVSPQPGSSSSLLTPISGPNTNVGESFTPLSSPALCASTESLLKTPPGRRKPKKLTDCIAMLTGKLQYQQPNPVIEPISPPILSPVHREVPKIIIRETELIQNNPEPELEAMDLSAKSRPKSPNQAPITWTVDGVLDLSKKPAIRHSVENMISPVSHRSSLSPSFMSPPPQITDPFVTNNHQNFTTSFSYSLPNLTPPVSDYSKNQSNNGSGKRKSNNQKGNKDTDLINYELPSMMGSQTLDLPPAAVLSMIGLGVPAITIPLPLPLSFQPPQPMSLMDFGPQQTSTPLVIPEISTPSNSNRSSSSRRNKPKPRNLRNETEIHENKSRSTEISNYDSTQNNKPSGTRYSSIDTIVDSIEAVIKQSAIEADSYQKFESSFAQLQEICSLPINNSKAIEQRKQCFIDINKHSDSKSVSDSKQPKTDESAVVEPIIKTIEKEVNQPEKNDLVLDSIDTNAASLVVNKTKKSNKTSKETTLSQSTVSSVAKPVSIITKDTDFEELIDQVRSPAAVGDASNKTDDEVDGTTVEKGSKSPTTEEEIIKPTSSSKSKGKRGGKKNVSVDTSTQIASEQSKNTNENNKKLNKCETVEKLIESKQTSSIEDISNDNVEQEKSKDEIVSEKYDKETTETKKNKINPSSKKSTDIKPLDDIQLAKIGYRRKSIRLLGLDPDLAEFYDEPIEQSVPKPEKFSNRKKSSRNDQHLDKNETTGNKEDNKTVKTGSSDKVDQNQTEKDIVNLSVPDTEVRKSPRRSQRKEKSNAPSIILPDSQENPSDDEPLSKKVSIEKLKKSPTKKIPPKKRDCARKIIDSPQLESEIVIKANSVSLVEKNEKKVSVPDDKTENEVTRPKTEVKAKQKQEKNPSAVQPTENDVTNDEGSSIIEQEQTPNTSIELKKTSRRKGRPPKNSKIVEDSTENQNKSVVPESSITNDEDRTVNIPESDTKESCIEHCDTSKIPTEEILLAKEDGKDTESDKLIDNESLKENQIKTVKARKKRKNELAAIIADQLLESFKEVDNSRKDELKILHDLSCEKNENNDELLVSAIRTTPVPRRKAAAKAKDAMESESESRLTSPLRKKIETQISTSQKESEQVEKVNHLCNKIDIEKIEMTKKKNKINKFDKDIEQLPKEPEKQKELEETMLESKTEKHLLKESKVDAKQSTSEVNVQANAKEKDLTDKPPSKKAKVNNSKKKYVPPLVSISTFIDDEEISFKRTTRKQFAQEIAILNQLKEDANKTEFTQATTLIEPEIRTAIQDVPPESDAPIVKTPKEKTLISKDNKRKDKTGSKTIIASKSDDTKSDPDDAILNQLQQDANKTEPTQATTLIEPEIRKVIQDVPPETDALIVKTPKEKTVISKNNKKKDKIGSKTIIASKFDDAKSDPDDDISLSELSAKPIIRTRKLSIELENLSTPLGKNTIETSIALDLVIGKTVNVSELPKSSGRKSKGRVSKKKIEDQQKTSVESLKEPVAQVQDDVINISNKKDESLNSVTNQTSIVAEVKTDDNSLQAIERVSVLEKEAEESVATQIPFTTTSQKNSPVLDLDITESLEKLDKTKKVTERNAILSDLFDHLKDDAKKLNDADSSGFETDISKNSSNISTKHKQTKASKKIGNNKKNVQKEGNTKDKLKLHLDTTDSSVDKMAALNIFCKGLNIPIVDISDPHLTPLSPTNSSSRSIFLRPSTLDKVLDNKNESEAGKLTQSLESPKKIIEPLRTSLRNKRSSIEATPLELNKVSKRRNSVRNERDNNKLKSPKLNDLLSTSKNSELYTPSFNEIGFNDEELDESSLKINEIVNNLIHRAEMSESDDEKLTLAQTTRNSNKKRVSIEEIPTTIFMDRRNESVSDFEDNANNDMLDMDVDDDCSVITDFTICRNESEGKIGSRIPRKRKHRKSVLCKKRKVVRKDSTDITEEFNCSICKKNFKKAEGLSKHKTTLSHIAKLSEIEYIISQKEKEKFAAVEQLKIQKELTSEPQNTAKVLFLNERPESPIISKPNTPDILIPGYSPTNSPLTRISQSPMRGIVTPTGIEPISSPEHIEPNYDRQNSLIRKAPDNSRVQLNSEERLFYEVCSMLKSTKASKGNPNTASVPKGNEISSNIANIQQRVGYSVKSPPTHSRSSPKAAFPKNDMNQFSDISSDSNPHIFRRQSKTSKEKTFSDYTTPNQNQFDSAAMENKNPILRQDFYDSFSDMGDSFQSYHNDSDNDIIPEGTDKKSLNSPLIDKQPNISQLFVYSDKESPISSPNMETKDPKTMYASSLHSTASSRNSNVSKIKTKAAMKGFDNFKISIPTTGLDMDSVKKSDSVVNADDDVLDKKTKKIKEPTNKRMFKNKSQKQKPSRLLQSNKKQTSSFVDNTSKDIYTFDDSQDSADKPLKDTFRSSKLTKSNSKPPSEIDKIIDKPPKQNEIVENDDSQQSSTSYSDRDDFVYGEINSSSGSCSETSSDSFVSISTKTKEPKKLDPANLQKKSLMMAKIFNKKKDNTPKQKTIDINNAPLKPKIDRDKLFDILKAENERKQEAKRIAATAGKVQHTNNSGFESKDDKRSLSPESKKSREIANIEAEWGMTMKQIEELIGVGNRKPKRRCATNRPKNLVETWSSDEYEEFHTTKDIIALIEDAEKKAQRKIRSSSKNNENQSLPRKIPEQVIMKEPSENSVAKVPESNKKKVTIIASNAIEESDHQKLQSEKVKKNSKKKVTIAKADKSSDKGKGRGRKKGTVSNKPKNVAYDTDSDFEHHIKPSVKKTAAIKQRRSTIAAPVQSDSESDDSIKTLPAKVWNAKNKEKLKVIQKSKEAEDTKPIGRRKRVASEMLYYWSSSSDDDEFGKISAPVNNIDEDESQDSDEHQQQHGWIVGDSHKKLVTLLAHAKAKKVDDWR